MPVDIIDSKNANTDEAPQTDKERQLAIRVQELFKAAYDAKNQLDLNAKWARFDDYKHGRQNPKQSEDHPGSVTPIIHPIIESQIADLVDRPYAVDSEGEEPSDSLYSEQVKHQQEYVLHRNMFKEKLNLSEHDRLELGTTVIKTFFDHDALDGRGLPTFEIVSPANFFPDPKWSATYRLQECEFVIHAVSRPLSWIRRNFKEKGKYVQREVSVPYDPEQFKNQKTDEVSTETSQKALLIECYMKDEDGELYCIHVANHIVLEDSRELLKDQKDYNGEPKRLQRRNQFPFVAIPCYTQRGIGWGQGDIELLIPTQDLINDLDDQMRINARLMGNPQIAFGNGVGRGFDVRKWTVRAGLRIPMRDVNAFRVIEGRNISSDVPVRREKAFQEADLISGRADVTRGEAPGRGVTAASAIIALQQAGQKSVLHKAEMFKHGWSRVLELLYDEMIEHWDEEMWVRIQGSKPDYEFVDPAKLRNVPIKIPNLAAGENEDTLMDLTDMEDVLDEDNNPVFDEEGNPLQRQVTMTREAQFDFRLSMGNGLPSDKAFVYQTLLELASLMVQGKPVISWAELREYLKNQVGLPLGSDEALEEESQQGQVVPPSMPQGIPSQPLEQPQVQPQQQIDPALLQQLAQAIGGMQNAG